MIRDKMRNNWAKSLFVAVGVLLFFYLIWRIGFAAVWENISRFGIWFAAILFVGAAWLFVQACAWSLIQNAFFQKVPLRTLFRIKIIGDALNILLPSASVGGEAARAMLLRKAVPLKEGIPSVLFDKTIEFVASTVFLAIGLLLGCIFLRLPEGLLAPSLICLAVTAAGVVLLILFSRKGFYGILLKLTGRHPKIRGWVTAREEQLVTLDANLRLLYTSRDPRILAAAVLHFLGRLLGTLEVLVILRVLGVPAGFIQALFIYVVIVLINTAFFVLPGQWGITESAGVLILKGMGQPAAVGLSLGVIRRIRKLAFVGLAIVLYCLERKSPPNQ
jgi:glycosyltransferase 2 family protein